MHTLFLPILDNGQGDIKADFLESFVRAFSGVRVHITRISDSDPRRARNRAAASFLATDCNRMLFIDGDISFDAQHITWLLEHDEPIVGGIYPIKSVDLRPCMSVLPGHKPTPVGGLIEVAWCGTGFLSITREVFEALKTPENRYTTHGNPEWDFFQSGVVNAQYLSEDLGFCHRAREAGFKVMVDTRIQLLHEGSIKYPIRRDPDRLTLCPITMRGDVASIWDGEYAMNLAFTPKTVLDIGGNIGGFTVWAKEQWPDARVIAYEPHPDNAATFRLNTKSLTGVELIEAALTGSRFGSISLIEGDYPGCHSISMPVGETSIEVKCFPAASAQSAEFVKIDTEGSELDILQGLDLSETKVVVLEYHRAKDRHDISSLLSARGFQEVEHKDYDPCRGVLKFTRVNNDN